MAEETSLDAVRRLAEEAIASGKAGRLRGSGGRLLDPVPVHSPGGAPAGWFVPVAKGDSLLGFIQLDAAGEFHRSARFPVGAGVTTGDWLDIAAIKNRARSRIEPDENLGEPVLSYEGNPDRLAWLVDATRGDGRRRRVFVAGTAVWTAPDPS